MAIGKRIKDQRKKNGNEMNKLLKDELFKVARDEYRQILLDQSLKHECQYSQDIEKAYGVLKKNIPTKYQEPIQQYCDTVALALIKYTFNTFADVLAEISVENDEEDG